MTYIGEKRWRRSFGQPSFYLFAPLLLGELALLRLGHGRREFFTSGTRESGARIRSVRGVGGNKYDEFEMSRRWRT